MKRWKVALGTVIGAIWMMGQAQAAPQYYGENLCDYPEFKCVKVHRGDTWAKLFPDERERDVVKRLNRTNIPLHYRPWIIVPKDLTDLDYMDLSPFPKNIKSSGEKVVVVDLGLQAFGAYDKEGYLVHWGPVSGGKGWCPDTNSKCETALGTHRVYRKQGANCISSKFPIETSGGAPMPYCMHYYQGFALHGSTLPGYNASHGCVRLFNEDAEWLNKHFMQIGTQVLVTR